MFYMADKNSSAPNTSVAEADNPSPDEDKKVDVVAESEQQDEDGGSKERNDVLEFLASDGKEKKEEPESEESKDTDDKGESDKSKDKPDDSTVADLSLTKEERDNWKQGTQDRYDKLLESRGELHKQVEELTAVNVDAQTMNAFMQDNNLSRKMVNSILDLTAELVDNPEKGVAEWMTFINDYAKEHKVDLPESGPSNALPEFKGDLPDDLKDLMKFDGIEEEEARWIAALRQQRDSKPAEKPKDTGPSKAELKTIEDENNFKVQQKASNDVIWDYFVNEIGMKEGDVDAHFNENLWDIISKMVTDNPEKYPMENGIIPSSKLPGLARLAQAEFTKRQNANEEKNKDLKKPPKNLSQIDSARISQLPDDVETGSVKSVLDYLSSD